MNKQHNIIYELFFPVSKLIVEVAEKVVQMVHEMIDPIVTLIEQAQVNRLKQQVLHKKLEDLTDPTFLDRALGVIK